MKIEIKHNLPEAEYHADNLGDGWAAPSLFYKIRENQKRLTRQEPGND